MVYSHALVPYLSGSQYGRRLGDGPLIQGGLHRLYLVRDNPAHKNNQIAGIRGTSVATGTDSIAIHFKCVTGHGRLSRALGGGRLHVAADALVGNEERVGTRVVLGRPGIQLADGTQQHIVLWQVARRRARNGPRGTVIVVALGAEINARIEVSRQES